MEKQNQIKIVSKNYGSESIVFEQEREESVRTDIFNVFISLVKHTRTVAISIPVNSVYQNNNDQAMETEDSPLSLLTNQVPDIVNGAWIVISTY